MTEQRKELKLILESIIEVINIQRNEDDSLFLRQNIDEVQQWLEFLNMPEGTNDLGSLVKEVAKRIEHKYHRSHIDIFANKEVLMERKRMLKYYSIKYKKFICQHPDFQYWRPEYGLDIIRICLLEVFLMKLSEVAINEDKE